jgi:hypothetical protein
MRQSNAAVVREPALGAIAEDAPGDDAASGYSGRLMDYPQDRNSFKDYHADDSTLASEQNTVEGYDAYRDDVSETSSFVTNDSEMDSSLQYRSRDMEAGLNPLFENLHVLPQLDQSAGHDKHLYTSVGSATAPGSVGVASVLRDDWTHKDGSLGASHHSGIWSPLPSSGMDSITATEWSHESPSSSAAAPRVTLTNEDNPRSLQHISHAALEPPSVSMTEEELREHLPANLLDDLDGESSLAQVSIKSSWFGLGRRRRSISVGSALPGEGAFADMKAGGSRLASSDRRRTKVEDTEDTVAVDSQNNSPPSKFGLFRRTTSDGVRPPPGFAGPR